MQIAQGRSVLEGRHIKELQERVQYISEVQLKLLENERQEMAELNRVLSNRIEAIEVYKKIQNNIK